MMSLHIQGILLFILKVKGSENFQNKNFNTMSKNVGRNKNKRSKDKSEEVSSIEKQSKRKKYDDQSEGGVVMEKTGQDNGYDNRKIE